MQKQKLVVNFSGGRTSAYMAVKLWQGFRGKYDLYFVFVNTGKEREETLIFVQQVADYFGFPLVWLEGIFDQPRGKGPRVKVVDFATADRSGAPFEGMIARYGIPNIGSPHCSSRLKAYVVSAWKRQNGLRKVDQALGIRVDEIDRMKKSKLKFQLIYPLISWFPTTKAQVNTFWLSQPFNLQLKSYEGNCDFCFKKSMRILTTLAHDRPQDLAWWQAMEAKYGPKTFFTGSRSAHDLAAAAARPFVRALDTAIMTQHINQVEMQFIATDDLSGCSDHCEPFYD